MGMEEGDEDVQLKMTVSPMTASTRCGWKVVDALSAVSCPPTVMTMVVCAAASVHARSCKVLANWTRATRPLMVVVVVNSQRRRRI